MRAVKGLIDIISKVYVARVRNDDGDDDDDDDDDDDEPACPRMRR